VGLDKPIGGHRTYYNGGDHRDQTLRHGMGIFRVHSGQGAGELQANARKE
jgi:hypothetical protein